MAHKVFDFDNGTYFQWEKSNVKIQVDKGVRNPAFQKNAAQIILKHAYKYTPYSLKDYGATEEIGQLARGHMADMAYAKGYDDRGQIVYTKRYAKYQYENTYIQHTIAIHPLATARWVEYAWDAEKPEIQREISLARLKYVKD